MSEHLNPAAQRQRIVDVSPYSAYPLRGGGPIRIFYLNRALAGRYEVFHYASCIARHMLRFPLRPRVFAHAPSYREYGDATLLNVLLQYLTQRRLGWPPFWVEALLDHRFPQVLYEQIAVAVAVQVEHPWSFRAIYRRFSHMPLVLSTQNVEYEVYAQILTQRTPWAVYILKQLFETERLAAQQATAILCVSPEDAAKYVQLYHVPPEKILIVPNGVDCTRQQPAEPSARQLLRAKLQLDGRTVVLFTGSSHPPNVRAAQRIKEMATSPLCAGMYFIIAGSVGDLIGVERTANMWVTGSVPDMLPFLQVADIAINPILEGGGTNIKLLDYLACALPVVTTAFGSRGLAVTDGDHVLIAALEQFPQMLESLHTQPALCQALGRAARQRMLQEYDWQQLGARLLAFYSALLPAPIQLQES